MFRAMTYLIIVISALVSGCASLVAPNYSADYAVLDSLKRTGLSKVAVGKVQPEDATAKVNKITLLF